MDVGIFLDNAVGMPIFVMHITIVPVSGMASVSAGGGAPAFTGMECRFVIAGWYYYGYCFNATAFGRCI